MEENCMTPPSMGRKNYLAPLKFTHPLCRVNNEHSLKGCVSYFIVDFKMAQEYSRAVLRVAIAQLAQGLGWQAIQGTPMELLTDVLERYILSLGRSTHRYSEQCKLINSLLTALIGSRQSNYIGLKTTP